LLGELRFSAYKFEEARVAYAHVVALPDHSQSAYAAYRTGWCLWALGDLPGARAAMNDASGRGGAELKRIAESELRRMESSPGAPRVPKQP
jgi:hypothetical protein